VFRDDFAHPGNRNDFFRFGLRENKIGLYDIDGMAHVDIFQYIFLFQYIFFRHPATFAGALEFAQVYEMLAGQAPYHRRRLDRLDTGFDCSLVGMNPHVSMMFDHADEFFRRFGDFLLLGDMLPVVRFGSTLT